MFSVKAQNIIYLYTILLYFKLVLNKRNSTKQLLIKIHAETALTHINYFLTLSEPAIQRH